MTAITYVGANAGVTGNNAPLTPTIHASAAAGDALLLLATIRNTAATVQTPAGWTPLLADGNVLLCGKYKAPGEPNPTVTFTGGAAGDTTTAQVAVFRTLDLSTCLGPVGQSNASAQNINLPASATPTRDGNVVLYLGWKQADWTSVGDIADAEIGETHASTGSGAGQVWAYDIQTTATATLAGFFTVTGGVAAISKSYLVAFNQQAAVSAIAQAVYPPRVLVSATNLIVGDAVSIYRSVAGVRTLVQGGAGTATDVAFLRVDGTLPFGVPVTYVAVVNGVEYATGPATYALPGGKVAVSDAISGLAAEVIVWAWSEKTRTRSATVFRPAGRNVVVAGDLAPAESDVELYTEATSSADNLRELLEGATQAIVQIRQPGGYDGVDGFYAVTSYTERRYAQDGSDQKRIHTLHLVEVDGWATAFQALGFTYTDLANAYAGLTYANLAADYATYLLLAQADLS